MPQLSNEPLQQYKEWSQAPTGVPTLDALMSLLLAPQIGIGASPVGMVGDKTGGLLRMLAGAPKKTTDLFPKYDPRFKIGSKGFDAQNFPTELPVRVGYSQPEQIFTDAVKGLNPGHALARARLNWPGAYVSPEITPPLGLGSLMGREP